MLSTDRSDSIVGTNYTDSSEIVAAFERQGYTFTGTTSSAYAGYAVGDKTEFSGTSASAPVVSGVLALAVEAVNRNNAENGNHIAANTRLMKHLIVATAQKIDADPTVNTDAKSKWTVNAAGNSFSASYGFGQIDAGAMVEMASDSSLLGVTPQTVASAEWYAFTTEETPIPSNVVIESTSSEPILEYVTYNKGEFSSAGVENASNVNTDLFALMTSDDSCLTPSTSLIADRMSVTSSAAPTGSSTSITATFSTESFGTTQIQPLEEVTITLALSASNLGSLARTDVSFRNGKYARFRGCRCRFHPRRPLLDVYVECILGRKPRRKLARDRDGRAFKRRIYSLRTRQYLLHGRAEFRGGRLPPGTFRLAAAPPRLRLPHPAHTLPCFRKNTNDVITGNREIRVSCGCRVTY